MTLGDIDQVFVRGKVDEADIGRVRLGQPARIRVETFKDKVFNGQVTQISPMGVEKDNVTNFEVRVSIDNPGKELKANMTANAEIVLEEHPNALIVPEAADHLRRAEATRSSTSSRRARRPAGSKVAGQARRRQRHEDPGARRPQGRRQGRPALVARACMREKPSSSRSQNLRANKLRSFLTMFGILWGMISVVVLSATGEGFRRGNEQGAARARARTSASSGAAAPACRPAASAPAGRSSLTLDDARAIAAESSMIAVVSPELERGGVQRQERYNAATARVTGIEPQYQDIRTIELEYGRSFTWTGRGAGRARRDRRLRHGRAAVRQAPHPRRDAHARTACRTRSSARSARRTRTATTAAPTTTRSSCRSRRWRATCRARTRRPARCRTSSSRRRTGSSTQLPRVLDERTGRIEDIDWPLEQNVRAVLARRHGFDPGRQAGHRDVGHVAADADVRPHDRPHEATSSPSSASSRWRSAASA